MIFISQLGKRFGNKELFSGVSLQLNPGQRYGLIGANGCGKSTFLKILTGEEGSDDGEITFGKALRLGVLKQDHFQYENDRIVDVAMQGDQEVANALTRLEHESGLTADEVHELSELITLADGYSLEARTRDVLQGLGIAKESIDLPLSSLSGGFKLRVLLAQVLLSRPDALLLDEPTNHLDILSIKWLEDFLKSFVGCAVVISHDRRFLDSISTRVLDVDYGEITDYAGNYSSFLKAKLAAAEERDKETARVGKIIAEKKAFVERFKAKASKARQAQSRAKQLEKLEVPDLKVSSRRAPLFRFQQERPTGKDVLKVRQVDKAYGSKQVLKNVSFELRRGERLAVIGENGVGKSTLLKIVADQLGADAGDFEWGVHAKIGYFAQDHHELLNDAKMTPLDYVWNAIPAEGTSVVRGQLGRMLFSAEEVEKKVTALSGGESARLIFARLIAEQPNILVLDEPTNHLDIEAIDALAEALKKFEGTLLFVSHDRFFVSEVADRILEVRKDGIDDFSGTFKEFLEKDGADHLDAESIAAAKKKEEREPKSQKTALTPRVSQAKQSIDENLSYEERKRRANRAKLLPRKRDQILAEIESLETEKAKIHAQYADPAFFVSTPEAEQNVVRNRESEIEASLLEKMNAWEEIELELSELNP